VPDCSKGRVKKLALYGQCRACDKCKKHN